MNPNSLCRFQPRPVGSLRRPPARYSSSPRQGHRPPRTAPSGACPSSTEGRVGPRGPPPRGALLVSPRPPGSPSSTSQFHRSRAHVARVVGSLGAAIQGSRTSPPPGGVAGDPGLPLGISSLCASAMGFPLGDGTTAGGTDTLATCVRLARAGSRPRSPQAWLSRGHGSSPGARGGKAPAPVLPSSSEPSP